MTRKILMAMLAVATVAMLIAGCGGDGKPSNGGDGKTDTGGEAGDEYARPDPPAEIADLDKPEFTEEMVAEGKKIFAAQCASCHGAEGKGDAAAGQALKPPAQDLTNPDLQAALSDHYIFWRVTEGGAALDYAGMTAFKDILEPDQRWAVIAYVRTLDD